MGRAFRCDGACTGAELYVRAKRGFCNCDSGVADDDEVDRVADIDLITPRFAAAAPGETVHVVDMHGRARRCDLFVAPAQGRGEASAMQHAALAFLETQEMKTWVTAALDGK